MVDSAARNAAMLSDGCNPEFVKGATFDGILEIPIIKKPKKFVIPCVRWGDERTYTTKVLPEKVAFLGVEKHSIVSIGTYGQLKDRVNRYYLEAGLDSMMETLEPEIVLVYSKLPDNIKDKYTGTRFVEYPDWTSVVREDH